MEGMITPPIHNLTTICQLAGHSGAKTWSELKPDWSLLPRQYNKDKQQQNVWA